nr:MAG TPA: hypothetical protein [Caudoviricetes sp.]
MKYQITYKIDYCTFDTLSFDIETVKLLSPQDNKNIIVYFKDDTAREIQNVFSISLY